MTVKFFAYSAPTPLFRNQTYSHRLNAESDTIVLTNPISAAQGLSNMDNWQGQNYP